MDKFAGRRAARADKHTRSCFVRQRFAGAGNLEKVARADKTIALAELRRAFGSLLEGRTPGRHGARLA